MSSLNPSNQASEFDAVLRQPSLKSPTTFLLPPTIGSSPFSSSSISLQPLTQCPIPSFLPVSLSSSASGAQLSPGFSPTFPTRKQHVTLKGACSTLAAVNHGVPQGSVLSPLLFSLFTHDCVATHSSNTIVKFADDTTVIGLITDGDETAYREEVRALSSWYQDNNLQLNLSKTTGMIVDYRK